MKNHFTSALHVLVVVVLVVASLVACGGGNSYEERRRMGKVERARLDSINRAAFKVAVLPTLDCLPLFVAREAGIFDTLGVSVRLRMFRAQMDCDTAVIGGSVEGTVTDLVRAERLQRQGISLRYPIATDAYWQLITNRLARIKELKQLSDKMIAITRYSATEALATMAIDSVKPKYDVYRVQINDLDVRLHMLLNNEMDAMLLPEPQATTARTMGHPVLMDSRDKQLRLGVFAFRSRELTQPRRRDQLNRFIKGYNMAVDSINKNGLQHYAALVGKYCNANEKTLKALPALRFRHAAAPRERDILIARKYL
jgi:NitT/TauT family transport system substrate-binding protein